MCCRPAGAVPGNMPNAYAGNDAAACAMASRFPLQQLAAGGPPCNSLPAHAVAATQQNFQL